MYVYVEGWGLRQMGVKTEGPWWKGPGRLSLQEAIPRGTPGIQIKEGMSEVK